MDKTKLFVYSRVSTAEQDVKSQIRQTKKYIAELKDKVEIIEWFEDKISGKAECLEDRDQFNKMLSRMDEVDGIMIYDYSRFTRDEEFGVKAVYSFKNSNKSVYEVQTRTIYSFQTMSDRIAVILKAMFAQKAREDIHANQIRGIEEYRAKNKTWGRPKSYGKYKDPAKFWKVYDTYVDMKLAKRAIAKLMVINIKTLYIRLRERKQAHRSVIGQIKDDLISKK